MNKFLEASLEGAEAIADALIENEIVKSIPIVGTAIKILSGGLDLRDKIFVSKVQRFILEIDAISSSKKITFSKSILSDSELMSSVGETALLVIDKLSDLNKAELLGLYFSCFLGGHLDQYQFKRISAAIDSAFIDDIHTFLNSGKDELLSQKQFMASLFSSGMTAITAGGKISNSGELYFEASSMGYQMIELWEQHKKT
jgi:hypothetical protein